MEQSKSAEEKKDRNYIRNHINDSSRCNSILDYRLMKLIGTKFQMKVWSSIRKIPKGKVKTYSQIAKSIGKPLAIRAVANAVGKNPYPPKIPCHRVIRSDGSLGGYSGKGGVKTKKILLKREGITL